MCVLPSRLLRIVCATNKPPGRPCRAVQSITLICSGGRRRKGKARGREGKRKRDEGGGGAPLRSSVYKPDRWSGALTRTIKQKTTGCFLLCFFSPCSFKAEPGSNSGSSSAFCYHELVSRRRSRQSHKGGLMNKGKKT